MSPCCSKRAAEEIAVDYVFAVQETLTEAGVNAENIRAEEFFGY